MNSFIIRNSILFVTLIFLQVVIFDNIHFLGYINPMIYVLFMIEIPYRANRVPLLFWSFFMGLTIDVFSDTGGIHAASSVFIAYIRPQALTIAFGKNFEFQPLNLINYPFTKVFTYISIMVVIHHILFYFLEIFNFSNILSTFAKIILASITTIVVCLLFIYIFSKRKS